MYEGAEDDEGTEEAKKREKEMEIREKESLPKELKYLEVDNSDVTKKAKNR